MATLSGTETLQVLPLQSGASIPAATTVTVTTRQLANIGSSTQYSSSATTTATTIPAVQIAGANDCTLEFTGAVASSPSMTLPTAALLIAALPSGVTTGFSYRLRMINTGGGTQTITIATSTGITLNGTATMVGGSWRDWYVSMTAAAAVTMQSIGAGTNS